MKLRDRDLPGDRAAVHDDSYEGWPKPLGQYCAGGDAALRRLEEAESDVRAAMWRLSALEDVVDQLLRDRKLDRVIYQGVDVPRDLVSDLMQHTLHDLAVAKRRSSTVARRLKSKPTSTQTEGHLAEGR